MTSRITNIAFALAIIICAIILGNAFKYKFKTAETISVTGLANKDFESDQIVWNGTFSRKSYELKNAYASVKEDETTIKNYLKTKGINDNEMVFSAIVINKEFDTKFAADGRQIGNEFTGYSLSQTVTVDSKDLNKVEKISREITELIQDGIELSSSTPNYFYSKLSELKLDLLAKASADAKQRGETIAKNSGGDLGKIKKCSMGVFQITGQDSNEDFSYGGAFNTSSRLKKATITVKVEYGID
ncbi:MAG: hypothetical protein RL708_2249 [Bacteroidota bacterium]|jgi:hypothetical protein